ncbi:MAG: hypothetical protein ACREBO_09600 [Novosphingobium sp.]
MFTFSKKAKAVRILRDEFDMQKHQIVRPLLALFVTKGNNEFDVALSYIIARARAIEAGDRASEAYFESDLVIVKSLADKATNPAEISKLAQGAIEFRAEQFNSWFPTFDDWLTSFKVKCAEVNELLVVDAEGKSFVDFMNHDGLRRAHRDRVDPKSLATQFAPTFHPDSFGR